MRAALDDRAQRHAQMRLAATRSAADFCNESLAAHRSHDRVPPESRLCRGAPSGGQAARGGQVVGRARAKAAAPVRTGGTFMRRVLASVAVAALPRRRGRAVLVGALALLLVLAATGCTLVLGHATSSARATATATATVAPTIEGRLAQVVRQAVGAPVQQVEATYDAQHSTVVITATVSNGVPNTDARVAATYELVKIVTFKAQQALWKSGIVLREATVVVQGLQLDEYGSQVVDAYSSAIVEASTAQHLDWVRLSADHAWDSYDHTWLREYFQPNY